VIKNSQKTLVEKLLQASQKVHQASLRGSGNYVVLSPESGDIFMAIHRMNKIKRVFNL
jgi:hypothetical protein